MPNVECIKSIIGKVKEKIKPTPKFDSREEAIVDAAVKLLNSENPNGPRIIHLPPTDKGDNKPQEE